MANLTSFRETIGGGVRPNQFEVQLTDFGGPMFIDNGVFSFLCHASSLPGSTIGQATAFHRGRAVPLAGERIFEPWTVTIYADQGMEIRTAFEQWSSYINDYANNSGETTPSNYSASGYVMLLDRASNPIKTYQVIGIWPINISDMQLDWQQNDVLAEFTVTFAVTSIDPVASTPGLITAGDDPTMGGFARNNPAIA